MRTVSALCGVVTMAAVTTWAQGNIAWISFHPGDNQPSGAAAGVGFTQAPDVGYTSLLSANGYNVTRFVTQDDPPQTLIDQLNTFDLIIVSRSVSSAHYGSAQENAAWNVSITKPVILMTAWALRDSRLGYVNGSDNPIDTVSTARLQAAVPGHPIFNGISLDAQNVMVNPYAQVVTADINGTPTLQRGISISPNPLDGNPTIIATVANDGSWPGSGQGVVIAEWAAGDTITSSVGSFQLGGRRMIFLSGSREADGVSSETAGIFDLVGDGPQLFLNAVAYMIPEPNTAALLLLGGLPLLFLRRR